MATLTLTWDHRITLNGREYVFQSPTTPPTLSLSELHTQTFSLATATTVILWDPTLASVPSEPTSFDFLYALASQACFLELTCNEDDANERVFVVPLKADIPFLLGADDAFYNFTATGDAYAGALDVIDRLRLRNQSGSTATVTVALGKT